MFKRPRGNKDTEVLALQRMTKRLKEDNDSPSPVQTRHRVQEDYINITFPFKRPQCNDESQDQVSELAEVVDTEAELLHYNRLKLQHKRGNSKYEIKMMQYRTNQCDSDNSSITSEMTDTNSEQDSLDSTEREHYNKLKVDLQNIKSNKKLLRGIQVLKECSSFNGAISSSSLIQSRKLTHRSAQVDDGFMKYKKEGHANRLHSVVRPRAFNSLQNSTSSLHKSRSTGDILQMSQDITAHQLSHSKSVYNMESETESGRDMPPSTHRSPLRQSHTQISPLTRTEHSHNCPTTELVFMNKVITFPCTHEGREINSAIYDFSVNIPKGTVRKRKSMEFQVGVCTHGPFVFPRGYKLVSPIIMVTSPTSTKLKKPMEIVLSHCIELVRPGEGYENITFFRAKRRESKGHSQQLHSSHKYFMEPTESSSNYFQIHNNHSTLTSTDLGFFCIMCKENMATRKHTNYCIVPVVPKSVKSSSWKVHYCVTYNLKAFIMEIKEHFGPNWETLPPKPFQLETRVGTQNREKIKIHFQRTLAESGWMFTLESDSKIHTSDIDKKWPRDSQKDLYPPRFTLRVCGDYATAPSVAQVWFTGPGMSQDLTTEVNLPLIQKYTPPSSITNSPIPDSLSSFSSASILLSSTAGSLLSNSEYDHLPSQEELDQTHIQLTYHNGHIDFPTDEDLQIVACEVIKAVDTDWIKLKASLEIPDHMILDILNQRTTQLQVFRLLKGWRQHSADSSKEELARQLRSTDARLHTAAATLLGH